MKLLLIRHGDPDYGNDTLTGKGHKQAELLATSLKNVEIDHMIVSPLGRARHTADYIIDSKKIGFRELDFFRELNGCYNGTDYAWDYHGCHVLRPGYDVTKSNWPDQVPYGKHMGPVFLEFVTQFDDFISSYGLKRAGHLYNVKKTSDDTIAIVCHAGVILTLLSHLLHILLPVTYSQFRIDPSSVTRLELETNGGQGLFRLMSLNDMSHARSLPEDVYRTPQS